MKITKTKLTEMIRKTIRNTLKERHAMYEPDSAGMSPDELSAHLEGERDKKKRHDATRRRAAAKNTTRGMELECGADMDGPGRGGRPERRLSDVFVDESIEEGLYESSNGMDEFCEAYVAAALWSTNDESDGVPLDENYGPEDISEETLNEMQKDCERFQEDAGDRIDGREGQAGHDFWLTRNGHGAGFWDGDWPEHGDALTDVSQDFGNVWLHVEDDGKIYS